MEVAIDIDTRQGLCTAHVTVTAAATHPSKPEFHLLRHWDVAGLYETAIV